MFEMILYLTNQISQHFGRLSLWLPTASICGLFSAGGAAPGYAYWVQPFGNGCSEYL
jgi:hypothetical protein